MLTASPTIPDDIEQQLKWQKPTWGKDTNAAEKLKATWLGHASFMVELPTPVGASRGPRILFDPVFSHRCFPSAYVGPARYTRPPCPAEEIPVIDIVVISHNHYDHMDAPTLTILRERHNPHFFAPLNNDQTFVELDISPTRFHCLDWWEDREISVDLPAAQGVTTGSNTVNAQFRLTCTPSQHQSNRGVLDRYHTLWSSWAIEEIRVVGEAAAPNVGFKVWFGGDTGYRHVENGQDEDKVPHCPAFKEIGDKFGSFDLALIPIGAYNPRQEMSSWHVSPSDSVRIFQDIKAKKALAMHWGTWVLTFEPVLEPPALIAQELKKAGLSEDVFTACGLGETVIISK
ncbi:hypothetical protein M408DRAFT_78885 [Serendipita vermifera MAFF 305830]|uniref:Metallo-beta-lactamase domain-containing protein n=1 Tax=Serendipita vermifera MAFF 305830 TaxID=933852 RepID=A0A0C2WZ60_SERVB|nr:hypothetical protein M408DRAFT_78885 [Serendipita vermifera MAFF 305830]